MYREKLMLMGVGLGSANRSIRQGSTADTNSADPSIFSCYQGRLTSSFSRAVVGLCLVAALILANWKLQPAMFLTVYGDQPERAWVRKGSKMFGCSGRYFERHQAKAWPAGEPWKTGKKLS